MNHHVATKVPSLKVMVYVAAIVQGFSAGAQNSTVVNQDIYIKDENLINVVPVNSPRVIVRSLTDCAAVCMEQACIGFFYNTYKSYCVPVNDYYIAGVTPMDNVTHYKRQIVDNYGVATLELNVCPPLQEGFVVVNMTSKRRYRIYIHHRLQTQSWAGRACAEKGFRLLRMEHMWHYVFIQDMLMACGAFKGKEFWIGATKSSGTWKFPDGTSLPSNYFCDYAPNMPASQFCVRFRGGCLDDQSCSRTAFALCEK